jgi:hypothetical protein
MPFAGPSTEIHSRGDDTDTCCCYLDSLLVSCTCTDSLLERDVARWLGANTARWSALNEEASADAGWNGITTRALHPRFDAQAVLLCLQGARHGLSESEDLLVCVSKQNK